MDTEVMSPDAGTLIASLRALRELIEKSADANEEATQLSGDVIDALERVELFKIIAPRVVGGMEAHPRQVIDALRTLSYFDGSTGWYCQAAVTGPAVAGAFVIASTNDGFVPILQKGFRETSKTPRYISAAK